MRTTAIEYLIHHLRSQGTVFLDGLSDAELTQAEAKFDLQFPPDWKAFLQTALPISGGFVNWRYGINSEEGFQEVQARIDWPLKGMLFDVQSNRFWWPTWGERPDELPRQVELARLRFPDFPKLIPIWGHRFLPSRPCEVGNPVFSVYQTDVIYYGFDLFDYFCKEFRIPFPLHHTPLTGPNHAIEFWGELDGEES